MSAFRRLHEEQIYQGFIIRVTNETFESPTGETFDRDVVHVPAAVAIVPMLDNGDVVCVRQFRPALGHDLLEIPAGMCDVEGEALADTAQRVLGEEAGYRAGTIEHLCTYHGSAGFSDARLDVFLGLDLTEVASQSHSEEEAHMTVERIALSDVHRLIATRAIIDAKTIIGLLLARDRLDGEMSPTKPLPLDAEEYLVWLTVERGRAANTVAAYRRDLNAYCAYLDAQKRPLHAVSETDIERYVERQRAEGKAATSIARALVAVRSLHRFLAEEGRIETNPAADVEAPKVPQGLPRPLSEAEVESLLASVVGNGALERRDRAILEVLYGTGIRISELVGLSLGDLDLDERVMRVFGKGSHERIVPVGRMAVDAMQEWLAKSGRGAVIPERWARRGDAEAVFLNARGGRLSRQGAWGIVRVYGDRVGLGDRLSPHVLRHSCATHMLDHGADIRVVQELLGHASVATTQVYTLVSAERLRTVYDTAHPRALRSR